MDKQEENTELNAKYYTAITFVAIAISLCSIVMIVALCIWYKAMKIRAKEARRDRALKRAKPYE